MMHCSQEDCKLKDTCYRYWLGQELKNTEYQYASFYLPKDKEDIENCKYFEDLKSY
jgi:hypothetical protein